MLARQLRCARRKFLASAAALTLGAGVATGRDEQTSPARGGQPSVKGRKPLAVITTVDEKGRANAAPVATCLRNNHVPTCFEFTMDTRKHTSENVLATGEADVHYTRRKLHITNPRILPAGSDGEGLPWLARVQLRRMAVFVSDIA